MNLFICPRPWFSFFFFKCVPLDIVQTVDNRTVWSLCISQYVYRKWVCMAVVVIIFVLILVDIYFCFAWLIQRQVQVNYPIKWDVCVTSLLHCCVYLKLCSLWSMHCEYVIRNAYYKFYRIQCTHTIETCSILPFSAFIFSIYNNISVARKEII